MKQKDYRERRGISAAEWAKLIGARSRTTVYRHEQGRVPRPDFMRRIIEVSGGEVGPEDFYADAREEAA